MRPNRSIVIVAFLAFLPLTLSAATKTWTGGGGNNLWSNGANWSGGVAPMNGDDLVFNSQSTQNDISGLSLNSITVNGGTPTLNGNAITLGAGGITTKVDGITIQFDIAINAAQTWTFGASFCTGSALVQGNVSGSGALTIVAAMANSVAVHLAGHISTSGALTLGPGNIYLDASNSFTGPLTIVNGSGFFCGFVGHQDGIVTTSVPGAIPAGTAVTVGTGGYTGEAQLHLLGFSAQLSSLKGMGLIDGAAVTFTNAQAQTYNGFVQTNVLAIDSGTQTIQNIMTLAAGTNSGGINVRGGNLIVDATGFSPTSINVSGGTLTLKSSRNGGDLTASGGTLEVGDTAICCVYQYPSHVNNLSLASGTTFQADLQRLTMLNSSGSMFGYLEANGNISLGNSALVIAPTAGANPGDVEDLIINTGPNPVTGTFAGLPEGALFTSGGYRFRISYQGGSSGRDVTATVVAPTQTTLTSSKNPSNAGDSIVLGAYVTPPSTEGSVTFYDGTTVLGTVGMRDSTGYVPFTTSSLTAGKHSLTAVYSGSAAYLASTSPVLTQVVVTSTSTDLSVAPNPASDTTPLTLSAAVHAGSGVATGSVTFNEGRTLLATVPLDASGHATLTRTFDAGTHSISASYPGDAGFTASTSNVVNEIVTADQHTQTRLIPSPSPSMSSDVVTLRAYVTSSHGTPPGIVTFTDGSTTLGAVALDANGRAVWRGTLAAGTHLLAASYDGAPAFTASFATAKESVMSGTTCAPIIAMPDSDIRLLPHENVTLSIATTGDQPINVKWFAGIYPDISAPLVSPALTDVTAPMDVWVMASNLCGNAFASATITIVPPHHRAAGH